MNTTLTISVPVEKNYHQSLLLCSCYRLVMLLDSTNDTSSSIWLCLPTTSYWSAHLFHWEEADRSTSLLDIVWAPVTTQPVHKTECSWTILFSSMTGELDSELQSSYTFPLSFPSPISLQVSICWGFMLKPGQARRTNSNEPGEMIGLTGRAGSCCSFHR